MKYKKLSINDLIKNLKIVHIQRNKTDYINNNLYAVYGNHNQFDLLETQLIYKNCIISSIYTELHPFSNNTNKGSIKIDITTNRKFIKKHHLPFKKTKVNTDDKNFQEKHEIQLKLGVSFVRKLLFIIMKEVKNTFNFQIQYMKSNRCNGIYMKSGNKNNNRDRICYINLERFS